MTFLMGCILALVSLLSPVPLNGAPESVSRPVESNPAYRGPSAVPLAGAPLSGTSSLRAGLATWYDDPRKSGLYAAAGPELRHGAWRGSRVTVKSGGHSVVVTLSDACWCPDRHGEPVLLDLSAQAFKRLAPLSKGVIEVEVTPSESIPLPPTDTEGVTP